MNELGCEGTRLTIRRSMVWLLYVAVYCSIFSTLPASPLAFTGTSIVATLFLFIDAFATPRFRTPGLVAIAFFACGLAYSVATGLFLLSYFPPPVPPKPPLPFWSGIYYLVSGGLIHDIATSIARGIALIFRYLTIIVACTVVSSSIALFTVRRRPHSKWLLLLNSPGILLCGYIVFALLAEAFASR